MPRGSLFHPETINVVDHDQTSQLSSITNDHDGKFHFFFFFFLVLSNNSVELLKKCERTAKKFYHSRKKGEEEDSYTFTEKTVYMPSFFDGKVKGRRRKKNGSIDHFFFILCLSFSLSSSSSQFSTMFLFFSRVRQHTVQSWRSTLSINSTK